MSGRLLVNLYLDSLYGFTVGFPPDILQATQPANNGFIQRFCVNFDAVFGIVAVLQTNNAPADRHDELGSWDSKGREKREHQSTFSGLARPYEENQSNGAAHILDLIDAKRIARANSQLKRFPSQIEDPLERGAVSIREVEQYVG
jgi:hypothetical protein